MSLGRLALRNIECQTSDHHMGSAMEIVKGAGASFARQACSVSSKSTATNVADI